MSDAARWQSKAAAQGQRIAQLEREIDAMKSTKRDHVFRLRQILIAALDGHPGWRIKAEREVGR